MAVISFFFFNKMAVWLKYSKVSFGESRHLADVHIDYILQN